MRSFNTLFFAAAMMVGLAGGALADSSNRVPYVDNVRLKVGQAMVVHGLRGACGKMPSRADVQQMEQRFADIKVGRIVAGKPGIRRSNSCNGMTPVIEAVFVAERPGKVKVEVFGDPITFSVR